MWLSRVRRSCYSFHVAILLLCKCFRLPCLGLQEKQYILSEAKKVFREHKDASSPEEVESLVRSGAIC